LIGEHGGRAGPVLAGWQAEREAPIRADDGWQLDQPVAHGAAHLAAPGAERRSRLRAGARGQPLLSRAAPLRQRQRHPRHPRPARSVHSPGATNLAKNNFRGSKDNFRVAASGC